MAKVKLEVEVSKEMHELVSAVGVLVAKVKAKAADGLQLQDVVSACAEESAKLIAGVFGVEQLPAEAKEDLEAFLNASLLPMTKMTAALVKKPEPSPVLEAPAPEAVPSV